MRHVELGPGAEFDLIRKIRDALGEGAPSIGDDCAVVDLGATRLALSSDMSVEGTHFRIGWLQPEELGWRAVTAALSDLAAAAATPRGVLVSLGIRSELPEDFAVALMEGAADAARAVGAVVWGGDVVAATQLTVDVAAVGTLERESVGRSGARPGDELFVTGRLGGPGAALTAWENGIEPESLARERFARPEARVREAAWLAENGARAMIDLSDGLIGDASHLAAASATVLRFDAGALPVHPATPGWREAAVSGEEYELLAAVPPERSRGLEERFNERFAVTISRVGRVEEGSGVVVVDDGRPVEVAGGFFHFG